MKKRLSVISVLMIIIIILSFSAPAAALDADKFEAREVTAYLYNMEDVTTLTLLFNSDLPEIPYIDVCDYFGIVQSASFSFSKNGDGTYSLSKDNGKMTVDTKKDTVTIDHFPWFTASDVTISDNSHFNLNLTMGLSLECEGGEKPFLLDLSAYNIDVIEKNGRVYFPVSVLNDITVMSYTAALYVDGRLYFTDTVVGSALYFDTQPLYDQIERSEALAEFTYNELCFQFDYFYGCPSNAKIAKLVDEVGFDKALDAYDEETRLAKQLLKSTSLIDFHLGLCILSRPFYDGGHTQIYPAVNAAARYDNEFSKIWNENFMYNYDDDKWLDASASYVFTKWKTWYNYYYNITVTKNERLQLYDKAMEWEGVADLYICGDTAVFSFDLFALDVILPFNQALDYAKEHKVKNFILDLTTNKGGSTKVNNYIIAMITNKNTRNAEVRTKVFYQNTNNTYTVVSKVDLNLDGEFDDADNEVVYDFDFALLTTSRTYSAASYCVEDAKENGIMIIGEKNGGGSCSVGIMNTPSTDGIQTALLYKRLRLNGEDMEGKGDVDVDLRKPFTGKINEIIDSDPESWGFYDYDDFYDFEALGKYVDEFYDKGDINGDGFKTNKDVIALFKYVSTLSDNEYAAKYDINSNGKINNKDVVALFAAVSEE